MRLKFKSVFVTEMCRERQTKGTCKRQYWWDSRRYCELIAIYSKMMVWDNKGIRKNRNLKHGYIDIILCLWNFGEKMRFLFLGFSCKLFSAFPYQMWPLCSFMEECNTLFVVHLFVPKDHTYTHTHTPLSSLQNWINTLLIFKSTPQLWASLHHLGLANTF